MNASERRQRARQWLSGDQCVYAPNVFDPLSARVAEDVGFRLGVLSAHGAEWMVNGGTELCRLTLTELAEQVRRVYRASDLSILVTGPFGFGNALNEMRYVEEMESAGASIVTIGDQTLPLRYGKTTGVLPYKQDLDLEPAVSVDEYVGKLRAARAARQDPSLVIAARSNALVGGDVAAAVERIRAYEAAGAEAVWLTLASRDGIQALHQHTTIPLIVGGSVWWASGKTRGKTGRDPEIQRFLNANGVRVASLGTPHIRAVVKAYRDSLSAMRDGDHDLIERIAVSEEDFDAVTRLPRDNEWIKSFLT